MVYLCNSVGRFFSASLQYNHILIDKKKKGCGILIYKKKGLAFSMICVAILFLRGWHGGFLEKKCRKAWMLALLCLFRTIWHERNC